MARRDLQGRVICITGASAGIGRATALACARAGMDVVLGARRIDRLEALSREIESLGRRAVPMECDVASDADVEALVAAGLSRFGRLDAVLANAGYGLEHSVADSSMEQWRDIFDVNLYGTLRVIWATVPHFRQRQGGHILITSSCVSRFVIPYYSAYGATKASQTQMARSLRLELEPEGIDVSVVHPITTETEFFDVAADRSNRAPEGVPSHTPRLFVQPADRVARAIVRCLHKPVPEVWTSHVTRFAAAAMVAFPRFPDLLFRREAAYRRRRMAEANRTAE